MGISAELLNINAQCRICFSHFSLPYFFFNPRAHFVLSHFYMVSTGRALTTSIARMTVYQELLFEYTCNLMWSSLPTHVMFSDLSHLVIFERMQTYTRFSVLLDQRAVYFITCACSAYIPRLCVDCPDPSISVSMLSFHLIRLSLKRASFDSPNDRRC